MKGIVIISAVLLALLGIFTSGASPNASDHLAGKVMIGIAVGFVLLALYAPPRVTSAIYFGAIALVIVAYSLPMSFWRFVGLAEQPSQQQGSAPPTDRPE